MSNHTPGPWNVGPELEIFYEPNGCPITRPLSITSMDGRTDEDLANARLIAAAPDLLAALESMVLYYGCGPAEDDASEKLYRLVGKALDKAKGRSEKTDKT